MNNFRFLYFVLLLMLLPVLAGSPGCVRVRLADGGQNGLVTDAYLALAVDQELKPVNATNTFYVDADTIYLSLKLNNAPSNTQVLVKITYLEGEASHLAGTSIFNETKNGQGTMYLAFAINPPVGGFPQGDYLADISANGKEQASISFKVQNLSAQQGWPVINEFKASSDTVPQGQSVTLSWNVSDATYITLQPEIGSIPPVGTRSITPSATTKYIITASNEAGATKRELTITIGAASSGSSDLVVIDSWIQGSMVYYTIKNEGGAASPGTYSHLYVNGVKPPTGYSSFVDTLSPGQEKTLVFSSYEWPYARAGNEVVTVCPTGSFFDPLEYNHTVKICADARSDASESNENNNCYLKLYGMLWDYDLLSVSHLATYYNSWDRLDDMEGLVESDPKGAHIDLAGAGLEMVPEQKPQGFIRGKFGFYYVPYYGADTETYPVLIPPKLKFVSNVGLDRRATGSDGVTFKLGFLDSTDTLRWLGSKKITTPGSFEEWTVDLSDQEGTLGYFLLQVDAGNTPDKDYAVWKKASLQQIND